MTAIPLDPHLPVHPIGVAARRSGLRPDVIRVWERRYGAVRPERGADSTHRLYSESEVRRLERLAAATRAGHAIRRLVALTDEQLEALAEPAARRTTDEAAAGGTGEARVASCVEAARALDPTRLRGELAMASVTLGLPRLARELVEPLMRRIGERWSHGELDPAQEHVATAALRTLLGDLAVRAATAEGPLLLVTTPAGQRHELGALLVAATASAAGWRALYLGPDLPADDVATAALTAGADAIALSVSVGEAQPEPASEVAALASRTRLPVLLGGRGWSAGAPLPGGVEHVATLEHLVDVLARHRPAPPKRRSGSRAERAA